jgi:UDP-glucose 4-epimerase
MKVLITGGGGFIGAWIIKRLLARGDTVRVLDFKEDRNTVRGIVGAAADDIEWQLGDVSRRDDVHQAAAGCDRIFHLAAILTPACAADPVRGAEVVLIGTLNAFEAARTLGLKQVVYMSSAGVFGPTDGTTPFPTTHYGAFKLAGEGAARAYFEEHGISSVGLRPLVVYGPGREVGLTAGPTLACRAAAEGRPYSIPFTGTTDFIYVEDVAAAFISASDSMRAGAAAYNLVGAVASVEDFVREILHLVPGASVAASGPQLPVASSIAPGTIRQDYPGIPQTGVAEGVARTVAFYQRRG